MIMADTTHTHPSRFKPDWAWVTIVAIPAALAIFAPDALWPTLDFAGRAIAHTGIFILFAVLAVAYMKATGAENLLARAFEGREVRMILLAAAAGGLSPFCSCEVIPFIAAMLAVGAPLSAVMAFWLASPLMDPAMFLITSGELGLPFAIAKTVSAVGLGLFGGFTVKALAGTALFADPLKKTPVKSCGCSSTSGTCGTDKPFSGAVVWKFWPDPARRATFRDRDLSFVRELVSMLPPEPEDFEHVLVRGVWRGQQDDEEREVFHVGVERRNLRPFVQMPVHRTSKALVDRFRSFFKGHRIDRQEYLT